MADLTAEDRVNIRAQVDRHRLSGKVWVGETIWHRWLSQLLDALEVAEGRAQQAEAASSHWQGACEAANSRNGVLMGEVDQLTEERDALRQQLAEAQAGAAAYRTRLTHLCQAATSEALDDQVSGAVEMARATLADTTAGDDLLAAVRGLLTMAARELMTMAAEERSYCSGDEAAAQAALRDAIQRLKALVGGGEG